MDPDDRNVADTSRARRRAAEAGHSGDELAARSLLDHADPGVRAASLGALARMDRVTTDDVRAALADPAPTVRRRAVELAITTGIDLAPLLRDTVTSVAEQAAWALGEREDPAAVDALIAATTHADALVREAAVAALGAIQDERGLEAILRGTDDKPAIRRRAILALAAFDGPEVDAALERALEDKDWQVRDAAELMIEARNET